MNREDREELKEMLGLMLKPVVELQQEHHRTLFGDGSNQNQGLRVNVDRLQQSEEGRSKHFWAVYLVLLGIILKDAWMWIKSLGAIHAKP